MYAIKGIVEEAGSNVHVLTEERIGYVVYEDEIQVVAEPFADTKTEP